MITLNDIIKAQDYLVKNWGREVGNAVIAACLDETPSNKSFHYFFLNCTPRGGDWDKILLTGIKTFYPKVYEAIPNDLGTSSLSCISCILMLLGIDVRE